MWSNNVCMQFYKPNLVMLSRALTSSEKISLNIEEEGTTQCLVVIARLQPFSRQAEPEGVTTTNTNDTEFVARVGLDGKFTYIDHRSVGILLYQ